ncbi:tRNA (adenosine(37)-N6)-threonylcarbamoyltransferase complex dimerization subunit type 1 TsaB [Mucilaginibacter limnophilus]|uniref:tRNA (Adenosine(37)-N6)-threonylcarbamoyltransferase complex dimerization subunit type 1 TsaB n=1 Tax=Mucilaginibacter limnophilus TaxID=1932778 RepID=A0A3S2VPY6_9SPHI|nr:tRNA (adenosine(37)-N6)-threonylcarbamoyltransferase complex dimerization subunit type 1 TsaB [Mucilaginibacter limnophilus]RVU02622.1 tRNA (adenosine(37)-N6)-threonylcarbamoyltransferase complex dimerization subunit type 1 TsaB [Mucilaginibacter limnophilus]
MTDIILQIETATTACSVAVSANGKVIDNKLIDQRNIHAEVLTLFIDELLQNSSLAYNQLDAIAVSSGPGSYTGLRIGVSTAKGLCFALDKPLIAVETLEAMAAGAVDKYAAEIDDDTLLCPMIDARRMEVYTALFDPKGNRITATSAEIIDNNSFAQQLIQHKIIFFGDGAEKCQSVLGNNINADVKTDFVNSASYITIAAYQKFKAGEFEDVAYFEPFYLKDFIAGKKAL